MKCHYCLNCPKFVQLIIRKIIRIVATRCQILGVKCTKFDFGPRPHLGAYSALPTPWLHLRGPTSNGG